MQERKTGVFGTVKEEECNQNCERLQPVSKDNPNTIYKFLFEKFDEENKK